jgi:hypothetical protein
MAHGHKSEKGSSTGYGPQMPSEMESPLNAQKEGAERGPSAPTGLPKFEPSDPLGICPGDHK